MNPHATPYVFPKGKYRELAKYLTENTEYDAATGCLEWTAGLAKEGTGRVSKAIAAEYGTTQAARLSWLAGHEKKLDKKSQLVRRCGNPKCVHPHHLREATTADRWKGDDGLSPRRQDSIGWLKVGTRLLSAQEVYQIQTLPPPRDPSLGLRWAFRYEVTLLGSHGLPLNYAQRERLRVIRAVRRCPIRATLTELPNGFRRYDLPAGITEIAFTAPPPPSYEEAYGWQGEPDDVPEAAPEAVWEPTAKAA
ncbi:hypothetical protein SOQ14_07085 [Erythrobacter sp. T5W1-R]|uniref:hypothetical protein n=1 Tax=Erythrobacter sp. T5W1-R TaxID=3101752 RepID=UPI002AFFF43E|nr:hypothetical protein [Erythrobacter sp. T5W1-R]MEA1618678.1 hypothetical protein [Erythrobacter sp. T5W1-R]